MTIVKEPGLAAKGAKGEDLINKVIIIDYCKYVFRFCNYLNI